MTSAAILAGDLTGAARASMQAQESALDAVLLCMRGDTAQAVEMAQTAADKSAEAIAQMITVGVPREAFDGIPDTSPLQLHQLDIPEARALLAELRPLLSLAERVDEARGRSMPDAPAGSIRGADLAESLGNIVARLELEVNGPKGRE